MNHNNKSNHQRQYNHDEDSEDIDELGDENSFEGQNKIFQMKSAIHSLQIEKNKLALEHQSSMVSLQAKNQHITTQYNLLRKQNGKLLATIKKLEDENEEMKKMGDTYRIQLESSNRRTADFHRSMEENALSIGDPSDLINELLSKDKKIEQLNKKLQNLSKEQILKGRSVAANYEEGQRQKYESQIKNLKNIIEDLKRKEIVYKRQYEGMIQTKDQIIRKMSTQSDDHTKKVVDAKDKLIVQLKRDIEELQKNIYSNRSQTDSLKENVLILEREIHKMKTDFKRKEETMLSQFQNEKDDLTKQLNEKLKKHLKAKEDKMNKSEEQFFELQNQLLISKQQNTKLKAQVTSLNNFNHYLQTANKEYEESKKKLQLSLYEKQKQAGQLKQNYFIEISEMTKTFNKERQSNNDKVQSLEQQLSHKNNLIQKYEQNNSHNKNSNISQNIQIQFQKVTKQRQDLIAQLSVLQKRYEQKSQKLLNAEKRIRKEYEERITGLETELISSRESKTSGNEYLRDRIVTNKQSERSENQIQKIIDISQLRRIQIEEKQRQMKRVQQDRIRTEKDNQQLKTSMFELERKMKQKSEDHKNLQISYEDLSEKYRKGVKELQLQLQQMGEQITQERKRAQRRKLEAIENEQNLTDQIKKYKNKIGQLEAEVSALQKREAGDTDLRLQRLTDQLQLANKQKQQAFKHQERKTKQKQLLLQQTNTNLQQYISQLQQSVAILSKNINQTENRSRKSDQTIEQELRQVKIEYSQSLSEMNMVLQKYKKLEEVHRQTMAQYERLKDERENLNMKYLQVYNERNRAVDELNSAYDQVNKLNLVLMSKEQQLNKNNRSLNYQHIQRPKFNPIQEPTRDSGTINLGFNRNPNFKLYERNEALYNMQTANKFPRYP